VMVPIVLMDDISNVFTLLYAVLKQPTLLLLLYTPETTKSALRYHKYREETNQYGQALMVTRSVLWVDFMRPNLFSVLANCATKRRRYPIFGVVHIMSRQAMPPN
jgi:hypothetical protein